MSQRLQWANWLVCALDNKNVSFLNVRSFSFALYVIILLTSAANYFAINQLFFMPLSQLNHRNRAQKEDKHCSI